jgi:hypothetical protein
MDGLFTNILQTTIIDIIIVDAVGLRALGHVHMHPKVVFV